MDNKYKVKQLIAQLVVDARLGKTGITNRAISDLMAIISDIEHDVIKEQVTKVEALLPQSTVAELTHAEVLAEAKMRQLDILLDNLGLTKVS